MKRFMNNFQSCRLLTSPSTGSGQAAPPDAGLPANVSRANKSAIRNSRPDSVGVNSTIRNPRSTIAFTLIEVMVAITVVTIGLTAILGLIPVGLKSGRDAADNTLAATIVQDGFSQMRRQALVPPWPPLVASPIYYDAAGTNQVLAGSPDRYFQIEVTSQPSPSTPNLQIIAATVTWPSKPSMTVTPPNTNVFVTEIAQYQ